MIDTTANSATEADGVGPPSASPASSARVRAPKQAVVPIAPRCLIVSASPLHAESIRSSANKSGWVSVIHRDPLEALREAVRRRFHLAIVDLAAAAVELDLGQLVSDLRSGHVPLVVVCGPPDDEATELCMWQKGIWAYVPGLNLGTDLIELFAAARAAAEKTDKRLANASPEIPSLAARNRVGFNQME